MEGGGGPAPFLVKTYDMVDDSSTDEIVSWSSTLNSFVVWNPPEFARLLLPTYFKHNNFSSFIRQLNTYGFRKIDAERWEFANEDFVKDKKHLLKNIHRRKPIHSHSNPQGSAVDPERAAFEEEVDKLSREKTTLEANLIRSKQQQPAPKLQLDELTQRLVDMEQRQVGLQAFLEKAVQNPDFVEHLALKLESMDCLAYNKRRRLPRIDHSQTVQEDSFGDDNSSSRHEFGNIFGQDFSKKLTLELSPAVSDINLISHSTQSSNEEGLSPQRRVSEHSKVSYTRSGNLLYAPETLDLSDTGADSSFSRDVGPSESRRFNSNEEGDGHISCHLNLTLASTPLLVDKSQYSTRIPQLGQEIGKSNVGVNEGDVRVSQKTRPSEEDATLSAPHDVQINKQAPRVNDLFWEQFLTERPGASETEEASSNFRGKAYGEQEDRRSGHGLTL